MVAFGGLSLSACAAALARRQTDLQGLKIGMTQSEFEGKLGQPVSRSTWESGWVEASYAVRLADEKRAQTQEVASFTTLGLWEFVAVPYELAKGPAPLMVLYGPETRALALKGPRVLRLHNCPWPGAS